MANDSATVTTPAVSPSLDRARNAMNRSPAADMSRSTRARSMPANSSGLSSSSRSSRSTRASTSSLSRVAAATMVNMGRLLLFFLPRRLDIGRQGADPGQEGDDLPDLLVGHLLVPRRHAGIANSVLDDPEHLPIGLVGQLLRELRRPRVEAFRSPAARSAGVAVAAGAGVPVDLHPGDELIGAPLDRIGGAGRAAGHGGIEEPAGDPALPGRRVFGGPHRPHPVPGRAERGQRAYEHPQDQPLQESSHRSSPTR